jgi:uncharacterized iron-regulated membrane protein
MNNHRILSWLSAPLVFGAFGVLVWLERRRPLRRQVESKVTHAARNLAVAGIGAAALGLTESPIALSLAALIERHDVGLLNLLRLPV